MNEFKYRESSSLFDNERIQTSRIVVIVYFISDSWYVFAQSFFDQIREFAHYQYYYTILIDDHVWCTIESRTRSSRETSFSLSRVERIFYSFWLEIHSNTKYCFSFFDLTFAWAHIERLEESLWSWSSHLTDSNWSKRLQRSSQNVKLTIVSELFFSMTFFIESHVVLAEISMILWSKIELIALFLTSIFTRTIYSNWIVVK